MAVEVTLETAQAALSEWIAASRAVADNISYTIGDRTLEREDAETCQSMITYWSRIVDSLKQRNAGHTTPGFRTAKWT